MLPPRSWRSRQGTALPSTTTTCTARRSGRSDSPMPPRRLFADTFYWIALLSPRDAFHAVVASFSRTLRSVRLATTDEILTEVLSHFAGLGPYWRGKAAALVHDLRSDPDMEILPQSRSDFAAALALYEARPDKGY